MKLSENVLQKFIGSNQINHSATYFILQKFLKKNELRKTDS